ncbi:MAG: hypothetical protein ACLRQF_10000 [Thomasclavelia ramosa]
MLFEDIQGKYMNMALGNISNVDLKCCLDESNNETKIKNLEFDGVSFINGEIFKLITRYGF